jgi:hypothetical protein
MAINNILGASMSHVDPDSLSFAALPASGPTVSVHAILTGHFECDRKWFINDPEDNPGKKIRFPVTSWYVKKRHLDGRVEGLLWDLGFSSSKLFLTVFDYSEFG